MAQPALNVGYVGRCGLTGIGGAFDLSGPSFMSHQNGPTDVRKVGLSGQAALGIGRFEAEVAEDRAAVRRFNIRKSVSEGQWRRETSIRRSTANRQLSAVSANGTDLRL
jgi:hypothetical protein